MWLGREHGSSRGEEHRRNAGTNAGGDDDDGDVGDGDTRRAGLPFQPPGEVRRGACGHV